MDKKNSYRDFVSSQNNPQQKVQEQPKIQEQFKKEKKIKVTGHPLNCRVKPNLNSNIHHIITTAEEHIVINETEEWYQLEDKNWIMKKFAQTI